MGGGGGEGGAEVPILATFRVAAILKEELPPAFSPFLMGLTSLSNLFLLLYLLISTYINNKKEYKCLKDETLF